MTKTMTTHNLVSRIWLAFTHLDDHLKRITLGFVRMNSESWYALLKSVEWEEKEEISSEIAADIKKVV
jgi:hypothetical protein